MLPKGVKPNPDKPGEYLVKDPHTGNWKPKPPGWSPYAQVGIGAAIVTGAVITGHAIAGCFASGLARSDSQRVLIFRRSYGGEGSKTAKSG